MRLFYSFKSFDRFSTAESRSDPRYIYDALRTVLETNQVCGANMWFADELAILNEKLVWTEEAHIPWDEVFGVHKQRLDGYKKVWPQKFGKACATSSSE